MSPDAALTERVHRRVLDERPGAGELRRRIAELTRAEAPLLDDAGVADLVDAVAARTVGLGALDAVLADPAVTEVMVNGPGPVWVERHGTLRRLDLWLGRAEVELLVERIVGPLGLRIDRTAPLVDARLADGSRVNAVVPPLALDGPCLTIRRFGARAIALDEVAPPGVAALLTWAVQARCNVVVSGGTGAGKTTFAERAGRVHPAGRAGRHHRGRRRAPAAARARRPPRGPPGQR